MTFEKLEQDRDSWKRAAEGLHAALENTTRELEELRAAYEDCKRDLLATAKSREDLASWCRSVARACPEFSLPASLRNE